MVQTAEESANFAGDGPPLMTAWVRVVMGAGTVVADPLRSLVYEVVAVR